MPFFPRINAQWRPQTLSEFFAGDVGTPTHAGVNVSPESAMEYTAVATCVRVRAETVAMPSLHLYQKKGEGAEKATSHPLYKMVHDKPNDLMSSSTWRKTISYHFDVWGNAYTLIDRPQLGRSAGWIKQLYPLKPGQIRPFFNEQNRLKYEYTRRKADGTQEKIIYDYEQILHFPGLGYDGVMGYPLTKMAGQAMGLGLAAEEIGARYFGQGTHLGAVVSYPGTITEQQRPMLEDAIKKDYAGLKNTAKVMVLGSGGAFKEIEANFEQAQYMLLRKFQLEEIARVLRVPLHLAQDLDRATFSNIEEQMLEFIMVTIAPLCHEWEQIMNMRLLTEQEREDGYYFEFDLNSLMRGDAKSRAMFYQIMRNVGAYSPNEIRAKENMNPRTDPEGDAYLKGGTSGQQSTADALEPVKEDANARLAKVEQQDIIREAEKRAKKGDEEGFHAWLKGWLNEHETRCEKVLLPYHMALNQPEQAGIEAKERVDKLKALLNVPLDGIRAALEGME